MYLPAALPGASGLVAQYNEFIAPPSGDNLGMRGQVTAEILPHMLGSLPWRLVFIKPGWSEYAVTPGSVVSIDREALPERLT
jgi:hypothetical protein